MKQATVILSDELEELLDAYRRDQDEPAPLSALVEAALKQYLRTRGYVPTAEYRPLRITPAEQGSGKSDISIEHDRYLYAGRE
jgi:hypothetical protein